MDRKTIVILVVCVALFAIWPKLVDKMFPPTRVPVSTNAPSLGTNTAALATSAPPATAVAPLKPAAALPVPARPGAVEELLTLTNDTVVYTLSSHWGGLKRVDLPGYPDTVDCRDRNSSTGPTVLNAQAPLPVLAILGEGVQGDGAFVLSRPAPGVLRAHKDLGRGLTLVKEFRPGSNYQMTATVRFTNSAAQTALLPSIEVVLGTAAMLSTHDTEQLVGTFVYDGVKAPHITEGWFANRTMGCFPGTPRDLYSSVGTNVVWAASHNQFFTLIAQPVGGAPAAVIRHLQLPEPSAEQLASSSTLNRKPVGHQAAFVFPATELAPGQSWEKSFNFYTGPKAYKILSRLSEQKELVMGFQETPILGSFGGFFAKGLLLAMNGIHNSGLGYGWCVVVITVIIKLLFWPLTAASTRSMKRMAALQPQMAAIREKYKDDSAKMNQKTMEFMKENKVNPMGGCLPMLIQIPVFFGFYAMLQTAIELRGAEFLWICDLSKPDTLFLIPGLNFPFNPMPLLMGVTMFWQARLTPPSPGMDPMQQKIMKYMPLMFLVFLYNFSSGLTLYWTVQNLLTIAQMKLTKSADTKSAVPLAPAKKK